MSLYSIQALQGLTSSSSLLLASASLATFNRPQLIARLDRAESCLQTDFDEAQLRGFEAQLSPIERLTQEQVPSGVSVDALNVAIRHSLHAAKRLPRTRNPQRIQRLKTEIVANLTAARRAIVPAWLQAPRTPQLEGESAQNTYATRLSTDAGEWLEGQHLLPRLGPYEFGFDSAGQERLKLFFILPTKPTHLDLLVRIHAAGAIQSVLRCHLAAGNNELLDSIHWVDLIKIWNSYLTATVDPSCVDLYRQAKRAQEVGMSLYEDLMSRFPHVDRPIDSSHTAIRICWDSHVLGLRQRRLSELFKMPNDASELDWALRRAVGAALQQDIERQLDRLEREAGGLLPPQLYSELEGLSAQVSYQWLSHRSGLAQSLRPTREEQEVQHFVARGLELHQRIQAAVHRTRLHSIVVTANREPSIQNLVKLVGVLPEIAKELVKLGKEIEASTNEGQKVQLRQVSKQLFRWTSALRIRAIKSRLELRGSQEREAARQLLPGLSAAIKHPALKKWMDQLADRLAESVQRRAYDFLGDPEIQEALSTERLNLLDYLDKLRGQLDRNPNLSVAFPMSREGLETIKIFPADSGLKQTVLTTVGANEGAIELYRKLLEGDDAVAAGPLAHALAARGGRWHRLFGRRNIRADQQVWPIVRIENGRMNIDHCVLYRNGQPEAVVFVSWRESVPVIFSLQIKVKKREQRALSVRVLDYQGRVVRGVPFSTRDLSLGDRHLKEVRLLSGDVLSMRIGLLESQQRRRLYIQGDNAEGFVLALPRYEEGHVRRMARILEDLVALAPLARKPFREFIDREFVAIIEAAANRDAADEERKALIKIASRSPYPMIGRLLRFLRPTEDWPASVRDLAAEIEFLRPLEARTYTVDDVVEVSRYLRRAIIHDSKRKPGESRYAQTHYHYTLHETSVEAGLREIFKQIKDELHDDGNDRTIKIILPERLIDDVAQRYLGPTVRQDPLREQAAYLEHVTSAVANESDWDEIRALLWRFTFVIDRGGAQRPNYVTLRNRARYEEEKFRFGYHIALPGEHPFAVDPVVLGIDPAFAHRYGLQRFGEYPQIDYVQPYELKTALILRLHSAKSDAKFLYLASYLLAPGDALVTPKGRMPGLLRRHRRMSQELRRHLESGAEAAEWGRMRIYVEGVQHYTPEEWEILMQAYASESSYDRAGIDVEQLVVQARLEVKLGSDEVPRRVTALTFIEDVDVGVPSVSVMYIVDATTHKGDERWVLVKRDVLERMMRTRDKSVSKGEWRDAEEQLRDMSRVDRRRRRARIAGGVFVYDRINEFVPRAYEQVWSEAGLPAPPLDRQSIREIFIDREGRFRISQRSIGHNDTGIVAFEAALKLPNYRDGRRAVFIGNDPTHPDSRLGSLNFEGAKFFWLAAEYARQQGMPLVYLGESSGAQMGLPHELIPRRPGEPLRIEWDNDRRRIYLRREQVEEVLAFHGVDAWNEVFGGQWDQVDGESRLYPDALLKGGVNQLSLRGSALTAGAMARAAAEVPTVAAVLGGKGRGRARVNLVGIGMYDYQLARGRRIQRGDPHNDKVETELTPPERTLLDGAVILLTGAGAVDSMFSLLLYWDNLELGGAELMKRDGMTTDVVHSESDGMLEIMRFLNDPASETISTITRADAWNELSEVSDRRKLDDPDISRSIAPALKRSVAAVTRYREHHKLPPNRDEHYNVAHELQALLDNGSFAQITGTDHYAITGVARMNGYRVGAVGAQMIPELRTGEDGKLRMVEREIYDQTGQKITVMVPDANPAMTLSPQGAGDIASFIETVTAQSPWMPIVGDLAASGYDPRYVAASGANGARLLSAIVKHPAPVLLWAGPGKKILGGMKVTVAKELGMTPQIELADGLPVDLNDLEALAHRGHMRVYADPSSFEAVLDPKGWKGIGFYKSTVRQVSHILAEERGLPEEDAVRTATDMVDQVIACMSSLQRAEADGSFTAVVSADKIRSVLASEVETWYKSAEFRQLRQQWWESRNGR